MGIGKRERESRGSQSRLTVQLLGDVAVRRDDVDVPLPASRKTRALLAYLALAPRPVTRSTLCELLWDVPNDPRGELRWSLSKLRSVLDEPGHRRIAADRDSVALDLADCFVDAIAVRDALQSGIESIDTAQLRTLSSYFTGEFLDGVEIERQPLFSGWLIAQRRRFRASQAAVLEHLVRSSDPDSPDVFADLDRWLQLAPLDMSAHAALLNALARQGRFREGEEHLEAAVRSFEAEGLESTHLRGVWRTARNRAPVQSSSVVIQSVAIPDAGLMNPSRRASIAVMPFVDRSGGDTNGGLAQGLAHDVITRLAKLRMMFVIAHGSVFALSERHVGPEEAGRMLNVDYVAGGSLHRRNDRVAVSAELIETRSARIIWADTFDYAMAEALEALDAIGNNLVASIAHEIEVAESNRAVLQPPNSLDAWGAYHRGLWHMYRFTRKDNDVGQHFLQTAIELDPTFSRAYAALSFTHFQNAFLHRIENRMNEIDLAYAAAGQSIMVDDEDPSSHWAMGRALWLRGLHDDAITELERSVELSPNFAPGHYALGFVNCQSGDPAAAIVSADYSRGLSPFDPLLFAMLSTRALGHLRLGEFDAAAEWALKGTARPNSHAHTQSIAAHCLAVAGRVPEARALMERIRRANPAYRLDDFLTSFHFAPDAADLMRKGARLLQSSS